jgi:hypothetical protein
MFSSKVVSFFLFLAFQAWYTFSLRWNSSLKKESKDVEQSFPIAYKKL